MDLLSVAGSAKRVCHGCGLCGVVGCLGDGYLAVLCGLCVAVGVEECG